MLRSLPDQLLLSHERGEFVLTARSGSIRDVRYRGTRLGALAFASRNCPGVPILDVPASPVSVHRHLL